MLIFGGIINAGMLYFTPTIHVTIELTLSLLISHGRSAEAFMFWLENLTCGGQHAEGECQSSAGMVWNQSLGTGFELQM